MRVQRDGTTSGPRVAPTGNSFILCLDPVFRFRARFPDLRARRPPPTAHAANKARGFVYPSRRKQVNEGCPRQWEPYLNSSEVTDRTLVLRAQSGERAAFGELVTRYMQRSYYTALGLVGNHDDALDLSQEAFARAFRARATIDAKRPFFPWLYQIIRRLCFNHTRDQRSRRQKLEKAGSWLADTTMGAQPLSPEKAVERAELRDRVAAAIERLAEREREALVLREFEGLRYREIAELLGIPIGTVMSRLYRARRSLAREIETAWARPVRREARDDG